MRAAVILALAALPPAHASAATCHNLHAGGTGRRHAHVRAAVDYEFSMPAGFHPDEAPGP